MAGYAELSLDQGTTYSTSITITDDDTGAAVNIAGYTISSQIRKSYYSANATANFTCTIANTAAGNVVLSMNSSTTANISPGRYVYDVLTISPANVYSRIIEGIITITPRVTR
jgi:hypothetical protein